MCLSLSVSSGGCYWEHHFHCMSIQQCLFTQRRWLVKGQANTVELALPLWTTEPQCKE